MEPTSTARDLERQLEGLFQRTTDGVLLSRPDGAILRANPAACRLLGRSEAELIRLGRQGVVVDEPALHARLAERAERGVTEGTIHFRHADGTAFPVEFTSALIPLEDRPPATCIIFRDARGRRHVEELDALQASFALLPVAVVVVEVPEGRPATVVAVNAAYRRIVGQAPGPGCPIGAVPHRVFLPDRRTEVAPADWPGPRAARTGQVTGHTELHLLRDDGSWRIVSVVSTPAGIAEPGRAPRAVTVMLDVTEEREAAQAVRASEAKLRALVEGAADAFVLHDFEGRMLDVNRRTCESLGYTREELLRLGVTDVEQDFDLPTAQRAWRQVQPGVPFTLHGHHRRKDGTTFPVELRFARVDDAGAPRFTAMVRDMTSQLERETALLASKRALRLLVGTNEALLHAKDEVELFREVCRVAVEQGGLRMAWAGLPGAGEGQPIRPVAWHGHEDGYLAEANLTWADEARGRGTAGTAMRTGKVAVANDVAADPRFAPWREAAAARGYASNAVLPLVHGGQRLGVIGAFAAQRGAFTPEVIDLLQRVADDLAFGLVALRERAAAGQAAAELTLAGRLIGLEVSRLDLRTGLVSMSPRARLQRGLPADGPDVTLEQALAQIEPPDRGPAEDFLAEIRASSAAQPARSPIRTRRFRQADGGVRWLENCATVQYDAEGRPASVLYASIDVTDRVQEREQLRALTARVQRVREEEKTRVARDLHDDLGQVLTALQLELRGAEGLVEGLGSDEQAGPILDRLVAASQLAGDTIAAVQRLSWSLRSEALERLGLDAALRQELRLFERRTGLAVVEALRPVGPVDREVATAAFRIAQEALTNVARHAAASRVEVRLEVAGQDLRLEIDDDGRGLAPEGPAAPHLGLLGMRERAREFHGEVTIGARPGGGTRVVARLPRLPESNA